MVTLQQFTAKIDQLNLLARHDGLAGLRDLYQYLRGLGWWRRWRLRRQLRRSCRGERLDGYLSVFTMYDNLRKYR